MGVSRIQGMAARSGVQPGAVAPLELENDDVVKSLKFSLAPWALTSNAILLLGIGYG